MCIRDSAESLLRGYGSQNSLSRFPALASYGLRRPDFSPVTAGRGVRPSLPDAADAHGEILGRRFPRRRGGGDLVAGTDVLDLAVESAEPHVRDPAPVGVADLLAELVGLGRYLRRHAPRAERTSDGVRLSPGLRVGHRDQYGRRH